MQEAQAMAEVGGTSLYDQFPLEEGVSYIYQDDLPNLYLNYTWRPNLSVTGADGLP